MTFGEKVIDFTQKLAIPDLPLPEGFAWLFPYDNPATLAALSAFYQQFFHDNNGRRFIFGINPGRFGAGVTGVPFTDPIRLEQECGINNHFDKKPELSSIFIWQMITAFGGPQAFFSQWYITSLSPLGFIKNGKNINYYDDKALQKAATPYIAWNIRTQLEFGVSGDTAVCLGEGQNFKYFQKLNSEFNFFKSIIPLPHPRFILQYKRKKTQEYVDSYLRVLSGFEK